MDRRFSNRSRTVSRLAEASLFRNGNHLAEYGGTNQGGGTLVSWSVEPGLSLNNEMFAPRRITLALLRLG